MKRIKLMFVTGDFKYAIGQRNDIFFINEISKYVDLTLCYLTGEIQEVMEKLGVVPDFILLNDLYCSPSITGLSSVNIPKGLIIFDTHWEVEYRRKYIIENNIQSLFTVYRDPFYKYYPELADRVYWHPHFINPEIFKDYGLPKDIDYLMMGIINHYYPLRQKLLEEMTKEPGFVYHEHPGYKQLEAENFKNTLVDDRFAREINRAKMFLTDDSRLHYPLLKYFEVLGCKTLLLAPTSKEIEDLGFVPWVHFVPIDENNFLERARYYLEHDEERDKIAQSGYEMVHGKHTVSMRVENFVNRIRNIVNK